MIEDVVITKRKQIVDERGKIMHMLRNDENIFKSFGEIYFSCIFPEKITQINLCYCNFRFLTFYLVI